MKITALPPQSPYISTPPANKKSPAFTSNFFTNLNGQRPNFTYFFRGDFEWLSFAKYLNRHFANAEKVNVYNAACSDGSEPFTLVMSLIRKLGREKAEKFFPIEAFDLNSSLINMAKNGVIPLLPEPYTIVDIWRLKLKNMFMEHRFLNYKKIRGFGQLVQMNDATRKHVNFSVGNVLTKVDSMEGENTVVMARNFWMYLEPYEQELLAQKLGRKLKKDSIIVLGKYDTQGERNLDIFTRYGFEETYIDYVYEKIR